MEKYLKLIVVVFMAAVFGGCVHSQTIRDTFAVRFPDAEVLVEVTRNNSDATKPQQDLIVGPIRATLRPVGGGSWVYTKQTTVCFVDRPDVCWEHTAKAKVTPSQNQGPVPLPAYFVTMRETTTDPVVSVFMMEATAVLAEGVLSTLHSISQPAVKGQCDEDSGFGEFGGPNHDQDTLVLKKLAEDGNYLTIQQVLQAKEVLENFRKARNGCSGLGMFGTMTALDEGKKLLA